MAYKIDPLSDARFDFNVGDEVIVLSTSGYELGKAKVDSESAPGLYGVEMTTGRYKGHRKGLNGCLLRHVARRTDERRPVAHPDYTLTASELAKLLAGDLAELPAATLSEYIAPLARQAMRDLAVGGHDDAERFWRRLDAYCEAEVREREEADDPGVTIKASDLQEGHEVKAEGAPAWSTIRTLYSEGGTVEAVFDWGRIAYAPDEDVNVRVAEVEAGAMSTSDGLGAVA